MHLLISTKDNTLRTWDFKETKSKYLHLQICILVHVCINNPSLINSVHCT